jgi:hypothetical protein
LRLEDRLDIFRISKYGPVRLLRVRGYNAEAAMRRRNGLEGWTLFYSAPESKLAGQESERIQRELCFHFALV